MENECSHPSKKRWQYLGCWLCCLCGRYFWGKKNYTPKKDIYGRFN